MLSASCASYRIRRQSASGTVVFSARPRGDRLCYPPLAMRQACLGRVPRRSSTRFAENLRSETRRFFRLESRRTQPYGRMARDETNQTGKYSVSGTMLPEALCLSLQRRTPCPCGLSDSLRACQKHSFLTRSNSPGAQRRRIFHAAERRPPKTGSFVQVSEEALFTICSQLQTEKKPSYFVDKTDRLC